MQVVISHHQVDTDAGRLTRYPQHQLKLPLLDWQVVISDYQQMDRILKEERNYILQMIKKIRASGCNVLLIQKSILRDAVTDLSLHYLVGAMPPVTTGWASDLVQAAWSCSADASLCPCCSVCLSACQQWHDDIVTASPCTNWCLPASPGASQYYLVRVLMATAPA